MKRRGREEGLRNIVDVTGDEVMESIKVYRRNHGDDPAIARLYKADGVSCSMLLYISETTLYDLQHLHVGLYIYIFIYIYIYTLYILLL